MLLNDLNLFSPHLHQLIYLKIAALEQYQWLCCTLPLYASVYVFSMAYLEDVNNEFAFENLVNDSVTALTKAKYIFFTRKLSTS